MTRKIFSSDCENGSRPGASCAVVSNSHTYLHTHRIQTVAHVHRRLSRVDSSVPIPGIQENRWHEIRVVGLTSDLTSLKTRTRTMASYCWRGLRPECYIGPHGRAGLARASRVAASAPMALLLGQKHLNETVHMDSWLNCNRHRDIEAKVIYPWARTFCVTSSTVLSTERKKEYIERGLLLKIRNMKSLQI